MRGDPGAAYRLIARYEQAARDDDVDPDSATRFEEYYYDRAATGLDTVALTEGWSFLADLIDAYDSREDGDVSLAAAAVGNAVAHYVIRSRLTRTVADIPTPAIEYLLACADATPNTKAWYESTTVGWAIGHPDVSIVDALHSAVTDDRTAWASAILRQTFHADQHAAAETVAEFAADGHLSELSTDFFDDLSRPTAWPAGPTGSWWEEFAYSFEWDEAIEARVRKIVSE